MSGQHSAIQHPRHARRSHDERGGLQLPLMTAAHKTRRTSSRRAQALFLVCGVIVGLGALGTGVALGYWLTTDSSNPAQAAADTLAQGATPGTPTTNAANGNTVSFSFSEVSTSSGQLALTKYTVDRYPAGGGSATLTSASCSVAAGTVNCADSSVPSGSWVYTDAPYISGTNWTGLESAKSPSVTVDTTTPTASAPSVVAALTYGTTTPNTVWVDNEAVAVTDSPTDAGGTGIASVAYYYCAAPGPCTSTTPWISIGSSSSGPSYSVPWTSQPTDNTYNVVAVATGDNTNLSSPSAETLVGVDTTGPSGGAASVTAAQTYPYGGTTYVSNEDLTLTDPTVSDAGSGVASVAYYYCPGASSTCNSSNGTLITSSTTASGSYSVTWAAPLPGEGPYEIVAVPTDNVTNASTSASASITVDKTPPTVSTPIVNGHS